MLVRQDSFISKLCWCLKQQLQKVEVGLIPKCSRIIRISSRWEKLDFLLRELDNFLNSEENLVFLTFLIKVWGEKPICNFNCKKKIVQCNIKKSDAVSGKCWKNIVINNSYMQHLFSKD